MEFKKAGNRFYQTNDEGLTIAEVTYIPLGEDKIDIDHTFVDPSLRGQGIAEQLVDAVVMEMEKEEKKITASCPYVEKLFERKPDKYGHIAVKGRKR